MKQHKIAAPDYDFEIVSTKGKGVVGKSFFTSELSIIKCIKGEAMISINSSNHKLKVNTNFLLVDLVLFKIVECTDDFTFTSCRFSAQFLNDVYPILENKIFDVLKFSTPDLSTEQEMEATDLTFRKLCLLYNHKNHAYRHRIAIHLVITYILEIYELTYKHVESAVVNTSNYVNYIIDKFCLLCNEHHTQHRNIEFYAEKLNISSRYLYKMTKEAFEWTPKQVIDYYVSGSIKKRLLTTVFTNQQIADQLNFPDQATFGQFFKRNVGMSPSEFRSNHK